MHRSMDALRSFGIGSMTMTDSLHDTIDIKDDLDDLDLDHGSDGGKGTPEASRTADEAPVERPAGVVELLLVGVANGIWAVVGLVIWLPQAVRAVLEATLRTIHAALTQQPPGRAVSGIQRVSRSYTDRFLRRRGDTASFGRRQELRPLRLVGETAWTVAFYLLVLRWLAPARFGPLGDRLLSGGAEAAGRAVGAVRGFFGGLPDLASFDANGLEVGGTLLGVACVGLVLGFWLGRREH